MQPWDLLFIGFNKTNFPPLFDPTWQIALVLLVVSVVFYNLYGRTMRNHPVHLDLNEWLLWTSVGVYGLLLMFAVFQFDFLFVLQVMIGGAFLFLWIRFVHFPPLIDAYEQRLARQRYFQRARASHPEATIRSRGSQTKSKRRRR